jgi:hypothetical protein
LVAGTPVASIGSLVTVVFAVFFLCSWSLASPVNRERLQKLNAKRGNRIGLAVMEAMTSVPVNMVVLVERRFLVGG